MNSSLPSFRRLIVIGSVLVGSALSVLAVDPSGTWKFQGEGPKGRDVDATLVLKWHDGRLSGTLEGRAGKVDITDATLTGDQVSFTITRDIGRLLRKRTFTLNYRAKLDGDTLAGTVETIGREERPVSVPWTAQRTK
jgi:hypothetical protein